jgi:hypothetical protein
MQTNQTPLWERFYRLIALLLLGFGVLAMFSIGLPFFILGLAMLILWPLRERRPLFASLFVGVLVFVIVGVLVAPLGCTATATLNAGDAPREHSTVVEGRTSCDNLLGITYEGTAEYDAPLWPAVATGFAMGTLAALITYLFLSPRIGAYVAFGPGNEDAG